MKYFSGFLFIAFLFAATLAAFSCLEETWGGVERPSFAAVLKGGWSEKVEAAFDKALPVGEPVRRMWGRVEYALFHDGRKGVVVGKEDWLFTDEELSCPSLSAQNMARNFSSVEKTQRILEKEGIKLIVAVIPAKARVLSRYLETGRLPACRADVYDRVENFLKNKKIQTANILSAMQGFPVPEDLYLKTDTHWTPVGARLSARAIRLSVGTVQPEEKFSVRARQSMLHKGDLVRFLPGVQIEEERVQTFTTENISVDSAGLLDERPAPKVTLVGTSYSANENWNFSGFLKEELKADVYNVAEEGQGPFGVMEKYLGSDVWKNGKPRLIIWEMPERYFLSPPPSFP
jgi:alginate O-acetyltransferase complex protein AlgJ